jgi:hypothetical protein
MRAYATVNSFFFRGNPLIIKELLNYYFLVGAFRRLSAGNMKMFDFFRSLPSKKSILSIEFIAFRSEYNRLYRNLFFINACKYAFLNF